MIIAGRNKLLVGIGRGELQGTVEFIGGVYTAVYCCKEQSAKDTTCVTGVHISPPGSRGADAKYKVVIDNL